ncbi:MAG TPA: hypothetical protein VKT77_00255 [Chthonomonadaceae bacterium]|nr:hypothetical protein [Chthonomonadaceae bacterium]
MPVPYRRTPRAAETGCAAYLDVVWMPASRTFYGGMLLVDGKGQPMELVHNTLTAPEDSLWPDDKLAPSAIAELVHTLFDACRRDPDLLVCSEDVGTPEFCRVELAPAIPCAQVSAESPDLPIEWSWLNAPPAPGMRAGVLAQELARRGFLTEPFDRIRSALRIVYREAPWPKA